MPWACLFMKIQMVTSKFGFISYKIIEINSYFPCNMGRIKNPWNRPVMTKTWEEGGRRAGVQMASKMGWKSSIRGTLTRRNLGQNQSNMESTRKMAVLMKPTTKTHLEAELYLAYLTLTINSDTINSSMIYIIHLGHLICDEKNFDKKFRRNKY